MSKIIRHCPVTALSPTISSRVLAHPRSQNSFMTLFGWDGMASQSQNRLRTLEIPGDFPTVSTITPHPVRKTPWGSAGVRELQLAMKENSKCSDDTTGIRYFSCIYLLLHSLFEYVHSGTTIIIVFTGVLFGAQGRGCPQTMNSDKPQDDYRFEQSSPIRDPSDSLGIPRG